MLYASLILLIVITNLVMAKNLDVEIILLILESSVMEAIGVQWMAVAISVLILEI